MGDLNGWHIESNLVAVRAEGIALLEAAKKGFGAKIVHIFTDNVILYI